MSRKEERRRQWNEYMETQFLACLLALGPQPERPDTWENPWKFWGERRSYFDRCVDFLYPLMNYTPCKSESREKQAYQQRRQSLYRLYRGWLLLKEKEIRQCQQEN